MVKTILLKVIGIFLLVVAVFAGLGVIGAGFYLWANIIAVGTSGSISFFSILWVLLKTFGYVIIYGGVGLLAWVGAAAIGDELNKSKQED